MEAESLHPNSDEGQHWNTSCDPRTRRRDRVQRPDREAEGAIRQLVIEHAQSVVGPILSAALLGEQIGVSARTIRNWKSKGRGIRRRGCPVKTCSVEERNEVIRFLHEVSGPAVGLAALRALFEDIPRCILEDLLRRYRHMWRWRYRQSGFSLTWLWPGSVWAIDFSEPKHLIDGIYPYLFPVRDLASHCQLAWLPFKSQTAEEAIQVLDELFRLHGPPLVVKSDNGSAFIAEIFGNLLDSWDVLQLFSPPRHPQYNGALERSNGILKTYTHHHAVAEGHPFRWTSENLEHARQLANTISRPWGHRRLSPQEAWEARKPITSEERQVFLATVARQRVEAVQDFCGESTEERSRQIESTIDRRALSQALQELNYLKQSRVTRPPKKAKRLTRDELTAGATAHRQSLTVPCPSSNRSDEDTSSAKDTSRTGENVTSPCEPAQPIVLGSTNAHPSPPVAAPRDSAEQLTQLSVTGDNACADEKKSTLSLAASKGSATMRQQTDIGAATQILAPSHEIVHSERSNTSWLRRCITLIVRLAEVAKIKYV